MTLSLKEFKQILLTNSTNGREDLFTIFYKNGETAVIHLPNKFGIKSIIKNDTGDYATITFLNDEVIDVTTPGIEDYMNIRNQELDPKFKRYGVIAVGESGNALTRINDSQGLTWYPTPDGEGNYNIVSDFNNAYPWEWKKCVGDWKKENGKAVFDLKAYLGESSYKEDGTNGDYTAVEIPLSFWHQNGTTLEVSGHCYDGFIPFEIFLKDKDPEKRLDPDNWLEKVYFPAYAMGLDSNGYGCSKPGVDNDQGTYYALTKNARKYKNGALGNLAILEPSAFQWFFYVMFTIESATQQCENFAKGVMSLRSNANDTCKFIDSTHVVTNDVQTARVVGQCITIQDSSVTAADNVNYKATHKIVSIQKCDEDGVVDASGTHQLIEVEDLGKAYWTYDTTGATSYILVARPWRTGECNVLTEPSGYIGENDGYHPFRYHYIENIWGNQFSTTMDFFSKRVGTGDSDYYLEHYKLVDPTDYEPSSASKPDATDLATDKFEKLGVETAHANYASGYIKSIVHDEKYPDQWIPKETTGGSATTFYCDYATLVSSSPVRSRRVRGLSGYGQYDGPSFVYLTYAPSYGISIFGGSLCFAQG